MNVLVYDPSPSRLQQTVNALGEGYNVKAVQNVNDLSEIHLYSLVLLHQDIEPKWVEEVIRQYPNTIVLVGMERKPIEVIRGWLRIGVRECFKYPIQKEWIDSALLGSVSHPVTPASSHVAVAKEETHVPSQQVPSQQSPEPVDQPRQPVQKADRALPWENESISSQKRPETSRPQGKGQIPKLLRTSFKKETRRRQDKGPDIEGLQIFEEDEHNDSFAPTRQEIVAITSARGGVGKSTIAYNLAVLAAEKGIRTVVVDVDPRGNLVSISNTKYRYTADQWDKIDPENDGEKTVMNLLAKMECGAFLLPSGRRVNGMQSETLEKVLLLLRRYFQLIIIDCEPRFTPTTLMAYQTANKVVVVTPDDITAFGRTIEKVNQMRDELEVDADKIKLIVNRVEDFDNDAEQILVDKSHCKVIAKIPNAADLRKLQKQGHAAVFNRKSGFTKQMNVLLSRVILMPQQSSSNSKSSNGWFSKLFKKSS